MRSWVAVETHDALVRVATLRLLAAHDLAGEQVLKNGRLDLRRDVTLIAVAGMFGGEIVQKPSVIAAPCHDARCRSFRMREVAQHGEAVRVLRQIGQVARDDGIQVEVQHRPSQAEQFELGIPSLQLRRERDSLTGNIGIRQADKAVSAQMRVNAALEPSHVFRVVASARFQDARDRQVCHRTP